MGDADFGDNCLIILPRFPDAILYESDYLFDSDIRSDLNFIGEVSKSAHHRCSFGVGPILIDVYGCQLIYFITLEMKFPNNFFRDVVLCEGKFMSNRGSKGSLLFENVVEGIDEIVVGIQLNLSNAVVARCPIRRLELCPICRGLLIPGFATSLGLYIEGSTVLVQLKTRGLEVLARESFGWS